MHAVCLEGWSLQCHDCWTESSKYHRFASPLHFFFPLATRHKTALLDECNTRTTTLQAQSNIARTALQPKTPRTTACFIVRTNCSHEATSGEPDRAQMMLIVWYWATFLLDTSRVTSRTNESSLRRRLCFTPCDATLANGRCVVARETRQGGSLCTSSLTRTCTLSFCRILLLSCTQTHSVPPAPV